MAVSSVVSPTVDQSGRPGGAWVIFGDKMVWAAYWNGGWGGMAV